MTTETITRDTARLPHRMTRAEEYLHLFEQRRQIDRRLSELAEILGPTFGVSLPKSGLRIVASKPGSLTCKGGPRA